MIVEKINAAVEKFKANNKDKSCLTEYEKDLLVFALSVKILKEEKKDNLSLAENLKCNSKINWIVSEMGTKYPAEAEEFKNYIESEE